MLNAIFGMLLTHALCQHDHEGDKYLLYFWRCIFMAWQQWLMHHPCPTGKADGRSPKSTPALGSNFTKLRRVRTRRSYAVNCHIFKVLVEQQRNTQINSYSLEVREKCRIDFWIGGEVFEALPKLLESNDYDQFCLDLQWHSINSYLQSQTSACCIMLHAWARPEKMISSQSSWASGGLTLEMSGFIPCHSWNSWTRSPRYSKITFLGRNIKHKTCQEEKAKKACYLTRYPNHSEVICNPKGSLVGESLIRGKCRLVPLAQPQERLLLVQMLGVLSTPIIYLHLLEIFAAQNYWPRKSMRCMIRMLNNRR